ncbi:phosphatidylglycerol:prolipoprotein diacylglycerol transferase [Natronospira proteinivora]|uniref:Phosphatidylglycerol--prolipoprotein diacylglyceryl transferase n=1 Tax=Natronospira proteinivora TaxID=1807133 RepID=A0ABT1G826_9GAMM|nr:prolipoprotein diacylglyceryl transferase [Natronospira proteinivora]MCP1727449.1 phosphatidylglycerol:prolipoprotein diacylglycerol transferase [Natronospira proteinivora]
MHYPDIDPVAISLGPMAIHWYGLMYVFGVLGAWWLLARRTRRPDVGWDSQALADMTFYVVLGIILGGRLGYILFYNFGAYMDDPTLILRIWQGGMSFHGGLLGVLVAIWLYGRRDGRNFFDISDFIAPVVPIGLGLGRIGNFINSELWGKPTDSPFGMIVNGVARHPSQLYQAALEGLVLFIVLFWLSAKPRPRMFISGMFALLYGIFRFLVEFVRMPDEHIGYLAWDWLTMGQLLSLPLIAVGVVLIALSRGNSVYPPSKADREARAAS